MGLWETSKNVLEGIKKVASIEVQQQVIELQSGILEMQERISALLRENDRLQGQLRTAGSLVYKTNCYWREGELDQGPFCARCWDAEKILIHLRTTDHPHYFACDNCNKGFTAR